MVYDEKIGIVYMWGDDIWWGSMGGFCRIVCRIGPERQCRVMSHAMCRMWSIWMCWFQCAVQQRRRWNNWPANNDLVSERSIQES